MNRVFSFLIVIAILTFAVFSISTTFRRSSNNGINLSPFGRSPVGGELKISTSTLNLGILSKVEVAPESAIKAIEPKSISKISESIAISPVKNKTSDEIKEVSAKSFEELINSSVIQLYCGNLNEEQTSFSDISRGTGIIIDEKGAALTNRHIVYDENTDKIKNNCFILKSPFPNTSAQRPRIYYSAEVIGYPLIEKFSDSFSKDKYYNDFAMLKIVSKPDISSRINLLLGFDYASENDYSVIENNGPPGGEASVFNFLPIDWNYQPKDGDILITLGYGIDASHLANQITSTIGKIAGNININKNSEPQILLIESNATAGFSGGTLINPKSKGLVGLVSWITAGDITGRYTVALFRDFLRNLMLADLNFDLKLIQNQ